MKYKKFKDLVFQPHPGDRENGLMAKLVLPFGIHHHGGKPENPMELTISVVTHVNKASGFGGFYGSQAEGTYEVACFSNREEDAVMLPLGEHDDILPYQTEKDISKLMKKIQKGKKFLKGGLRSMYQDVEKQKENARKALEALECE